MRILFITILACLGLGISSAYSRDLPVLVTPSAVLQDGLSRAQGLIASQSQVQCAAAAPGRWPGLTLDKGRVVAADLVGQIGGYAREAGVTGGLGGNLRIVTSDQDYDTSLGEKPIPGTLRAALNTGPEEPRWIVFSLGKEKTITLKAPLRTPDNVTLDGSCSGVTIQAPLRVALVYVFDKRNVIIARLNFRQTNYVAGQADELGQTCIRLNGLVDAVAIIYNDIRRCGDGLLDITTSPSKPVPEQARITISYNHFAEHDKVMLFGTFTCGLKGRDDEACGASELEHNRKSSPGLYLTLYGNLFEDTTQRHPRVFGRVMAHILGNVIAYSSYGTLVSNGARALIDRNIYLMTGKPTTLHRAVWTTTTQGAMRGLSDVQGFIKARNNRTAGNAIIGENEPGLVDDPSYRQPRLFPAFDRLPLTSSIACIASRVGPLGLTRWPDMCQSGN